MSPQSRSARTPRGSRGPPPARSRPRARRANPAPRSCRARHSCRLQVRHHEIGGLLGAELGRVDADLGMLRRLVRGVDAGEVLELPAAGLAIEPLDVAAFGHGERRVDEHLEELPRLEQGAGHAPLGAERRDERYQYDEPRIDHEARDLRHAADVLDAILRGEPQILVETVAHVVAVEEVSMAAERRQLLLDAIRDGRLAGAREPREPQHAGPLPFLPRTQLLVDVERLPVDVLRAAQREVDQAGANRAVADAVDEDEAAQGAIVRVGLEGDRLIELDLAYPDVVELE